MTTATIVHKLPGQSVPDDYVRKVLQANPTAFGFAGQENGKITIECSSKSILLNEVKELMKAFEKNHLVMYFMNGVKCVLPDDVQPWTLNDGKEDPTHYLAMFYEGNFGKYDGKDGNHTGEYCAADIEIFPKLGALYKGCGKDISKFIDGIRDDKFQSILCNYFDDRGVFVFLPPTGDPIWFGKNNVGGQFAWGNVSHTHGYTEKPAAKAGGEDEGGLSFLRGRTKSAAAIAAPQTPAPTPDVKPDELPNNKPAEPVTEPEKKAEPETFRVENGVKLTRVSIPPKLLGNKKAANLWLRTFNGGKLDENIQRSKCGWVTEELIPLAQRTVGSKEEVEALATEVHTIRKAANVKADETASKSAEILTEKGDKPITNSKSTVREPYEPKKSAADYLPVMDDKEKERAMGRMVKFMGRGKQPTGLEIQKMEQPWPVFSDAIGVKFDELITRPVDELAELFDGSKIAACAFIELRRKYLEAAGLNLDAVSKKLGAKAEEAKATPKTETVEDEGGLSFLRGKKKVA